VEVKGLRINWGMLHFVQHDKKGLLRQPIFVNLYPFLI
jgi:hypothetical protein